LIKFKPENGDIKIEQVWASQKLSPASWLLSPVRVGEHVYLCTSNGALTCLEFATGKVLATDRLNHFVQFSMTYADSRFYVRGMSGMVGLLEASPDGFHLRGSFDPPRPAPSERTGVFPVISDGRLYLRDMDWLLCYDVKDPAKRRRGPRPAYVPSPQDVVEKMLELAKVTKDDQVVDLGCGDGRIVVTAAKKYGARAAGFDIDKDCVRRSLENVQKNNVGDLVRIELKDMLDVDLSKVDVVTLYLVPALNARLVPQFGKMKAGSRIVSHAAAIPGYKPDKVISFVSKEDELERKIYLWTTPLQKEKSKE
jgi:hypothetical protein